MTVDDKKTLMMKVKDLCKDKSLIEKLGVCLRTSASSHQNSDIQSVLDLINKQPQKDQSASALLSLTRALRNLDEQVNELLSSACTSYANLKGEACSRYGLCLFRKRGS